jgi:hypothetical protein
MVGPEEPVFSAMISQTHVALNKALQVEPQGIDIAPLCLKVALPLLTNQV